MISRSCAWRAPLLAVIWLAVLGMCMWWGHACGWRALKPVPATCDARPDRPRLPAASAADGAGHADNAGQPAPGPGPAKPRPGKRERARMRVHAKQYPGRRLRPDGAGLAAASADVGEQSTRALQQQPKLREGRRARNDGEPTPHAPAILEAMESTSAADAFRKILLDPETGLPDDAELTEIYMRYERGLPLSTRQQVWLDATSDVGSRPHIVLNQSQCSAPPRPSSSAPITPPPFYYRPILGCGDFANCADCRYRYNLPANYTPPPAETRPQNASEFLRRFFEGGKLLVEELRRMKRERGNESILELISDDPPVEHACGFHDLMRAADPAALPDDDNTTMSEQEALTTIYSRLATSQAVSDFNMRRALQVTSPHCRPWSLSRQGLVDEITRIRKRLAVQDSVELRLIEGEETEVVDYTQRVPADGEIVAVRSFGVILNLPMLGREAFLHMSNVAAQDAVEVYEDASAQRLLDTLRVGASFPVLVIKISPLTRYMIEVSRKAALHASSKRGNSTTITLTQVKRACIYLAAWQRAALPATTAATPAAASSPTPTLPGVPPPRSARTRRSSVRRPRTRRVRAVAAAAAGGGGGGVSSAGGGIADEHEAVTGEVG